MQVPLSFPAAVRAGRFCAPFAGHGAGGAADEKLLGKRVLIVEDEALLAFELELAFAEEGAEIVGPALSLSLAMTLAETTPEIDCAILDVDLGGRDVFGVAQVLQARGVPFLFHTARAGAGDLDALFPGSRTLPKPARPEDLARQLAAIAR
jgi:DNA-binding response OmpR family regulator